jgi:hypothetical protein
MKGAGGDAHEDAADLAHPCGAEGYEGGGELRSSTKSTRVKTRETVRLRAENGGPGRAAWKVTACEGLAIRSGTCGRLV